MANNAVGRITQITGAVVDVQFDGEIPPILDALHIKREDGSLWFWKLPSILAKAQSAPLRWMRRKVLCAVRKLNTRVSRLQFPLAQARLAAS